MATTAGALSIMSGMIDFTAKNHGILKTNQK